MCEASDAWDEAKPKSAEYYAEKEKWFKFHDLYMSMGRDFFYYLKSASNLNDNLNCSKELEHYASW